MELGEVRKVKGGPGPETQWTNWAWGQWTKVGSPGGKLFLGGRAWSAGTGRALRWRVNLRVWPHPWGRRLGLVDLG